jgi:hypothetical protein
MFRKGTRLVPVSEAVRVVLRVAADHCHKCEAEENEDQDDLAAGEPELSFTVSLDCKNVEETACKVSVIFFWPWALVDKVALECRMIAG